MTPVCHLQPEALAIANRVDCSLLTRLRAGEPAAFEELVRGHSGRMLAVALRMLRRPADAEDAVQDAFASAFRALPEFEGSASLGTWLHRIVVNACLMKLRFARSRPVVSIEPLLPAFDDTGHHVRPVPDWHEPGEQLERSEVRAQVRECIDQLPDDYRVILLLRDIEGLDTAEAAGRLGISEVAAKVRLHRARQALRSLLAPLFARD